MMKSEEGQNVDYKISFDASSDKARIGVLKDILACANSGGGRLIFGADHGSRPGISANVVKVLDSAKMSDLVRKFTGQELPGLKHHTDKLSSTTFIFTLEIPAADVPLVLEKEGHYEGRNNKKDLPLFWPGDILVRHSSKTEKVCNHDMRSWAERLKSEERDRVLRRIGEVARMPEGFQLVRKSGEPIDTPTDLLENACVRRRQDDSHLLDGRSLLWVFQHRLSLSPSREQIAILLASALRRNPTLYWWVRSADGEPGVILDELRKALYGRDRDKSDAARSVLELTAVYASKAEARVIVRDLRRSDYKHFRDAAARWTSLTSAKREVVERVRRARLKGVRYVDMSDEVLEETATALARELFIAPDLGKSRRLGDVTRAIWFKHFSRRVQLVAAGS